MPNEGTADDGVDSNRFSRRDVLNVSAALGTGALAANAGVPSSVDDPMMDCTKNVIGTLNCLESARQYGTIAKGTSIWEKTFAPAIPRYNTTRLRAGLMSTPSATVKRSNGESGILEQILTLSETPCEDGRATLRVQL